MGHQRRKLPVKQIKLANQRIFQFTRKASNSDDRIAFCSYATQDNEILGEFRENGFISHWGSEPVRKKRLEFLQQGGTQSCQSCYFRTDHKPTILYTVQLHGLPEDIQLQSPITPKEFLSEYNQIMATT